MEHLKRLALGAIALVVATVLYYGLGFAWEGIVWLWSQRLAQGLFALAFLIAFLYGIGWFSLEFWRQEARKEAEAKEREADTLEETERLRRFAEEADSRLANLTREHEARDEA